MKTRQWILTTALTGLFGVSVSHAAPTIYDLTSGQVGPPFVQATAPVNGAKFLAPSGIYDATGTGVFNPFVRIQQKDNEQGYNTSDRKVQFDENTSPQYTRDVLFSDVPIVTLNNTKYLEFVLDINEDSNITGRYISLDRLQLFVGANQATNTAAGDYDGTNVLGTLTALYDLDGLGDSALFLDYGVVNIGSGRADLVALIPLSVIPTGLQNSSSFVYLYSQFGLTDSLTRIGRSDAGFEEWAYVRGSVTCPPGSTNPDCIPDNPGSIPEPGTLALLGLGLMGLAARARRVSR